MQISYPYRNLPLTIKQGLLANLSIAIYLIHILFSKQIARSVPK